MKLDFSRELIESVRRADTPILSSCGSDETHTERQQKHVLSHPWLKLALLLLSPLVSGSNIQSASPLSLMFVLLRK